MGDDVKHIPQIIRGEGKETVQKAVAEHHTGSGGKTAQDQTKKLPRKHQAAKAVQNVLASRIPFGRAEVGHFAVKVDPGYQRRRSYGDQGEQDAERNVILPDQIGIVGFRHEVQKQEHGGGSGHVGDDHKKGVAEAVA